MKEEKPFRSGGTYLLVMLKEDYGKENEYSILTGCQGMFELNKDGTVNFFDALGGTDYKNQPSAVNRKRNKRRESKAYRLFYRVVR
jgi:hypothetical protein